MDKNAFLNISGHPLHDDTAKYLKSLDYKVLDIPVPNIEFTTESFLAYIETVMSTLKKNKSISKLILTGKYTLLAPGLTPIAISLISALHGATGHFPKLAYLVRNRGSGIFEFGGILDLFELRLKYRDFFR